MLQKQWGKECRQCVIGDTYKVHLVKLTLTWCHSTPTDTPTRPCINGTSTEHQIDDVACACFVSRKGGAAALLHQCCPVTVLDCQVVPVTGVMVLNVKCSKS